MDLAPGPEETEISDTIDRFLGDRLGIAALRRRLRDGTAVTADDWAGAAGLGLFGLGLPEASGGAGFTVVDEVLAFRQVGRHLAPVTLVAGVIAAAMADATGRVEVRDAVVAGEAPVALAIAGPEATVGPTVSGRFRVVDLDPATLVLALDGGGAIALVAAEPFMSGEPVESLDPAIRLRRADVAPTPAVIHDTDGATGRHALHGSLLLAAMSSGIADAVRDMAATHATERVQFGRPIGTNQAIKHPCAEMALSCEAAESLLYFAAVSLRDARPDAAFQIAAARRVAANAALHNARANVQIHGGMGYTFEHDAHLFAVRCHVVEALFGAVHVHRSLVLADAPAPL